MLAVFAVVIIALSVTLTVFSVKNDRLSESGAQAYESLSEALGSDSRRVHRRRPPIRHR